LSSAGPAPRAYEASTDVWSEISSTLHSTSSIQLTVMRRVVVEALQSKSRVSEMLSKIERITALTSSLKKVCRLVSGAQGQKREEKESVVGHPLAASEPRECASESSLGMIVLCVRREKSVFWISICRVCISCNRLQLVRLLIQPKERAVRIDNRAETPM
jgi:hypothetical protein